jgi:hypothetical protein
MPRQPSSSTKAWMVFSSRKARRCSRVDRHLQRFDLGLETVFALVLLEARSRASMIGVPASVAVTSSPDSTPVLCSSVPTRRSSSKRLPPTLVVTSLSRRYTR